MKVNGLTPLRCVQSVDHSCLLVTEVSEGRDGCGMQEVNCCVIFNPSWVCVGNNVFSKTPRSADCVYCIVLYESSNFCCPDCTVTTEGASKLPPLLSPRRPRQLRPSRGLLEQCPIALSRQLHLSHETSGQHRLAWQGEESHFLRFQTLCKFSTRWGTHPRNRLPANRTVDVRGDRHWYEWYG